MKGSVNPGSAQSAALQYVSAPQAIAVLTSGAGAGFMPAGTPSGFAPQSLSLNGIVPFGSLMMPQIFLTGNAEFFYQNITTPTLPLLLMLDDSIPNVNRFSVNGLIANVSEDPFGDA